MTESNQRKRRFNPSMEESEPDIVRLYRERQPSFAHAGGFEAEAPEDVQKRKNAAASRKKHLESLPRPQVSDCEKCQKPILESWLWEKFALAICDDCKDTESEHKLLSRTEVMSQFLLKGEDLDMRKPPLPFLLKKNPHNPRYGDMKLYVRCQAVKRMLMVHGSWEEMEEKKKRRADEKERRQEASFDRKVKEMRRNMRAETGTKASEVTFHTHEYGPEEHLGGDEFVKKCKTCDYKLTFERM